MDREKQPLWFRYGIAVLAVALATLVRYVLYGWVGGDTPQYISFYPAVTLATLYAGFFPGLLAVALSSVAAIYLSEPVGSLHLPSLVEWVGFVLFVLSNLLIVWICEKMHRADHRAALAEAQNANAEMIKAQAAAIQQSEERYRAIFETAVDAIVTLDERGIVESINPSGERLFGYRADELVGRESKRLLVLPESDLPFWENYRDTARNAGPGHEVMALHKDGTTFAIYLAISEMHLGDRRVFTAQMHDISAQKELEKGLEEAKEAALAANASKDQFLANLSHELRTPLTPALMIIADRESDPSLTADLRQDLTAARRNLEMEARLIDDLLDLNRAIRGKILLHRQPQDLHSIIHQALNICRADLEAKGLKLSLELHAAQVLINGDAGRLQQVFWNLLRNAAKFTPPGGSVAVRSSNPSPKTIRVEIADTGIGMTPEIIARLFVPFEQGAPRITQQFGGMGMGLAISKALVDLHDGYIEAWSGGEGRGATFTVELPLAPSQAPLPESASPVTAVPLRGAGRGPKLDILLVEDHLETLQILSRLLENQGNHVTAVQTMGAALAAAQTPREGRDGFDLVISDLGLPDGDGCELMRKLREHYGLSGIALSGYGMEEDVEKSRDAGFGEHLIKPVKFTELLTAISRVTAVSARS